MPGRPRHRRGQRGLAGGADDAVPRAEHGGGRRPARPGRGPIGLGRATSTRKVGEVLDRARDAAQARQSPIRAGAVPGQADGRPGRRATAPSDDPVIRQELARYITQVRVNGWTMRRSGAAGGRLTGADGSLAKLTTARICQQSRDLSYRIVGAHGMLTGKASPLGGDLQTVNLASPGNRLGGGTDEIQLNVLGERALGLPREPSVDKDVPYRDLKVGTQTPPRATREADIDPGSCLGFFGSSYRSLVRSQMFGGQSGLMRRHQGPDDRRRDPVFRRRHGRRVERAAGGGQWGPALERCTAGAGRRCSSRTPSTTQTRTPGKRRAAHLTRLHCRQALLPPDPDCLGRLQLVLGLVGEEPAPPLHLVLGRVEVLLHESPAAWPACAPVGRRSRTYRRAARAGGARRAPCRAPAPVGPGSSR